jgi:hypothetical protein
LHVACCMLQRQHRSNSRRRTPARARETLTAKGAGVPAWRSEPR